MEDRNITSDRPKANEKSNRVGLRLLTFKVHSVEEFKFALCFCPLLHKATHLEFEWAMLIPSTEPRSNSR